jgi:hypothetical protein
LHAIRDTHSLASANYHLWVFFVTKNVFITNLYTMTTEQILGMVADSKTWMIYILWVWISVDDFKTLIETWITKEEMDKIIISHCGKPYGLKASGGWCDYDIGEWDEICNKYGISTQWYNLFVPWGEIRIYNLYVPWYNWVPYTK